MNIEVLKAGLLTSLQDLGRFGYQKYGVSVSGAMDTYSLRLANLLVGNEEHEGALEITLLGPTLAVKKNTLLAITGANLFPTINDVPVPMWRPIYITQDCILKFGSCISGCRAYLAVAGGFQVPKILNSKSTYFKAQLGGFQGRALQAGDILALTALREVSQPWLKEFTKEFGDFISTLWYLDNPYKEENSCAKVIRILSGNEFFAFTNESVDSFFSSSYQITNQSDRMGYRLTGASLFLKEPLEMISEAIGPGIIQVPPDGNPIILLADRQTVGGYPQFAKVIAVDLPKIAQSKPGDTLVFRKTSLDKAEKIYVTEEKRIRYLKNIIQSKYFPT